MKRTLLSVLTVAVIGTIPGISAQASLRGLRGHKHQRYSVLSQRRSLQISQPYYTDEIELSDTLTMRYRLDVLNDTDTEGGTNALSVQMVYEGLGWIGFAIAGEGGGMVGSQAVIGRPIDTDEEPVLGANPAKYNLLGKSVSEVTPMDEAQQTLIDASIEQNETSFETTLTFTKLMDEPGELPISASEPNVFLWAVGPENELSYHGNNRGSFTLDFGVVSNGTARESVAGASESSNRDENSSGNSRSSSSQNSDSDESGSSGSSSSKSSDSSSSDDSSSDSKSKDSKSSSSSSNSYDSYSSGSDDKYWKSKKSHNKKKHHNYKSSDDKYKSSGSNSYSSDKHKSSSTTNKSSYSTSNSKSDSAKSYSSASKSYDNQY